MRGVCLIWLSVVIYYVFFFSSFQQVNMETIKRWLISFSFLFLSSFSLWYESGKSIRFFKISEILRSTEFSSELGSIQILRQSDMEYGIDSSSNLLLQRQYIINVYIEFSKR